MLKAFLTTVLLASSTAAVADTPTYHPRRYDVQSRRSMVLAQGMSVGTSGAPRWIPLDARFQPDLLRFDLRRGRTFVATITLVYVDGRRETLRVDRPLNRDERSFAINVDQRGLRGVLVDTGPRRFARGGGGQRRAAVVDVVGLRR